MEVVNPILEEKTRAIDPQKSTIVEKEVDVDIDLGTLLASDYNALNSKVLRNQPNSYLQKLTRDNVQLLINQIWNLPTERVEEAIVANLPQVRYVLPRSQHVPKPKPLTKWQQFAKEKGIKSKRDKKKLKWDDVLQKWIPNHGYKQVKAEEQKEWLVEINKNNELKDPIQDAAKSKQERRSKNELQRLRNIAKSKNIKVPQVGLPTTDYFPNKDHLATAITVARTSTASAGKFQDRLTKEKDAKGVVAKKMNLKRKASHVPLNATEEKRQNIELVENVLKSNKKILTKDFSAPAVLPSSKKKVGKKSKGSKKPKAGKGKRDMRLKVGGRKRRQ